MSQPPSQERLGEPAAAGRPLPLSVAIVCKDNERTIGRTLESVRGLAAEIVAVDSGSTDGTVAILERAGARVIPSEWLGHVKTKQKALEQCTQEWVLCLDSDESVLDDLARSIRSAIGGGGAEDEPGAGAHAAGAVAYRFNRQTFYRDRPLRHAWQPEFRVRLVKRGTARWGGLDPHDVLEVTAPGGRVETLAGTLRHDSFETFAEHLRTQWSHARTMAESLHRSGKRGSVWSLMLSPPAAFLKQLVVKRAILDGVPGWLAAASSAAGALMKHAVLLEHTQKDGNRGRRDPNVP